MGKHADEDKLKNKHHGNHHPEGEAEQKPSGQENNLEKLEAKLSEKEKEAADCYDKYVRTVAEMENYKKFTAREKADLIKFGNEHIIRDMLPILDGLDRALEHAEKECETNTFTEGVKMIHGQLLSCLEKYGVQRIEAVGRFRSQHPRGDPGGRERKR